MRRIVLTATGVTAALILAITLGQITGAYAQQPESEQTAEKGQIVVGTFDQRQAFQPYQQSFAAERQKIQREVQQQMQGQGQQGQGQGQNRRRQMMQARQKMQQRVQEAAEKMRTQMDEDMGKVLPEVAEESGVDLIVPEVSYKKDHIKTKDVSEAVTNAISEIAPSTQPAGGMGGMMGGQGGQGRGQGGQGGQGGPQR